MIEHLAVKQLDGLQPGVLALFRRASTARIANSESCLGKYPKLWNRSGKYPEPWLEINGFHSGNVQSVGLLPLLVEVRWLGTNG